MAGAILIGGIALYALYQNGWGTRSTGMMKMGSGYDDTEAYITDFSKSHGPYTDPTLELVVGNPLLRTSNKFYHVPKTQTMVYGQWGIPRIDMATQSDNRDSILIFANPGGDAANPLRHY